MLSKELVSLNFELFFQRPAYIRGGRTADEWQLEVLCRGGACAFLKTLGVPAGGQKKDRTLEKESMVQADLKKKKTKSNEKVPFKEGR